MSSLCEITSGTMPVNPNFQMACSQREQLVYSISYKSFLPHEKLHPTTQAAERTTEVTSVDGFVMAVTGGSTHASSASALLKGGRGSRGPASGGPSSRRVMGGGVRCGGPTSSMAVGGTEMEKVGSWSRSVMGGGVRRGGPWSSTPVLPRVVVMCVVTVTCVVDSSDEVLEVEKVVDVLVSVQVSMLVVAEPLAASAVAEADSDSPVRVEDELVRVEVSMVGEQDTWSQIVVVMVVTVADVETGATLMLTLTPEVTQTDVLRGMVTVPVEVVVVMVSLDGMLHVGGAISLAVVLVVGKGAMGVTVMMVPMSDDQLTAVEVVQLSVVV